MKEPSKKKLPNKVLLNKDQHRQDQKPGRQVKKNNYSDLVGLAILIVLGIIIYSNTFHCSFHFDDLENIVDNSKIHNLSDIKAWWNFYPTRPIGIFSFALNYHFNQLDVFYYHLVNVIIHLINACLVWWLTLLIFSSPVMKDQTIARNKKVLAFLTALLFVTHPLATQSVTYIIQRMASMTAMFYLLSLALYVKARLTTKRDRFTYLLFAGSLVSGVMAVLTKENAYTLPFAILLFELFFLRTKKFSINFRDYRVILVIAALLGIIILVLVKFSSVIFKTIPPGLGHAYTVTPLNYLFTQFSVIVKYIQLLFLPINQKLDYDFPISSSFFEIRTVLCFIVLLSLIILAVLSFKRNRIISFGIFWFFLTLSVESSIIPINDLIFEHRTYLPSFGFFLILSTGIYFLLWKKYRNYAIVIFVIIAGVNSVLTYERNKVWKDDLSLWNDNVAKTPNLAIALVNRGYAYSEIGQWDNAIDDYSKAIENYPTYARAYVNRGVAYGKIGHYDKAIADCSRAIAIDPKYTEAYYDLGIAEVDNGQWEKAIADCSRAIELQPDYAKAWYNRGVAYGNLGQYDKAIADYSKASGIDQNYSPPYFNLGLIHVKLGQWDKAIDDFSRVLEINSNSSDAYCNRGVAYGNLGQYEKAIADFSAALEIDPKNKQAYSDREYAYRRLQGRP
jgi:tetratricopeptide (TPR) repeat protein